MVATRFVIGQTGPASLALLRYAIGFLCLLPPLLAIDAARAFCRAATCCRSRCSASGSSAS